MSTLGKHWNLSEKTKRKLSKIAKQKRYGKWMKGRKFSKETRRKISEAKKKEYQEGKRKSIFSKRIGEKNHNWKGDKVGYRCLHLWVRRKLGKPTICKLCGKTQDKPKSIHWANKSGRYLRDLSDWISLCVSCHKKYY